VPAFLRRGLIEPLALRLPRDSRFAPLRKLRSYVEQARIPLPERLEYWNLMYAADLEAMLEPDFRAAIEPRAPLDSQARRYGSAPAAASLHRMLYLDWQFTLADNDLRKVSSMCELAGIAVDYPMLHPDVIEASMRIPARLMMRGGRLRHFYKEAMRGFLPDEILHKPKHGFGLPFALWLRQDGAFAELVYSLLADLRSRRLVRAAFLERLLADQRSGDASYFGYAIWDLAMLEAWLAAHAP
jgi:asparagine synthase (glutamine-hydrolysing)